MEDLLDSIYIRYDFWSRLWIAGLFGVCTHWGFVINFSKISFAVGWYVAMLIITVCLMIILLWRFYDQVFSDSSKKHILQKYTMFFSGPALFATN